MCFTYWKVEGILWRISAHFAQKVKVAEISTVLTLGEKMIRKSEYNREVGIRLVKGFKGRLVLVIGLWEYYIRIELQEK